MEEEEARLLVEENNAENVKRMAMTENVKHAMVMVGSILLVLRLLGGFLLGADRS